MNVEMNAMVLRREGGEEEFFAWFRDGELHIRTSGSEGDVSWVFDGEHSDWFIDGLVALRKRSRRMRGVTE